eukprot:8129056-Pyramimonas_sp.AAC.1
MAPRWPKTGQMAPKRPPRRPPGRPERAKILICPWVFEGFWNVLLISSPTAQDGPRGHQHRPKSAQEPSKMAP